MPIVTLLYLWVKKYKKLENIGFNFSNKYDITYDSDKKIITISKNNNYMPGLFNKIDGKGSNITNVSAIIGNNTVGKTTLIDLLLKFSNHESLDSIGCMLFEVKESDSVRFVIEGAKNRGVIKLNCENFEQNYDYATYKNSKVKINRLKFVKYSNVLNPYYLLGGDQFSNDISISKRLRSNLLKDSKKGIVNYLNSEFVSLIRLFSKIRIINDSEVPLFIIISSDYPTLDEIKRKILNNSNYNIVNSDLRDLLNELDILIRKFYKSFEYFHIYVLVSCFLTSLYKTFLAEKIESYDKVVQYLRNLINNFHGARIDDKAYTSFLKENRIEVLNDSHTSLVHFEELMLKLKENGYLCEVDRQNMIVLMNQKPEDKEFQANVSFLYKFYSKLEDVNIRLSYSADTITELSSGEYARFLLYGKVYDWMNLNTMSKMRTNICLLLDEADLMLHPEWQTSYFQSLLEFLNSAFPNLNIQIIFTTHSPLMLSDLPNYCIVKLERDKESGQVRVIENNENTFGANVTKLLANSFFLENGVVGAFAKKKINEILKQLNEQKSISEDDFIKYENFIKLIGEDFIREKLGKLLEYRRKSR